MFYDLSYNCWNEDEMKAILKVLRSGRFTVGEVVEQFETQFANKVGARYAVMTNSGSSALLLAVASLFYKKDRPLRIGDEVLVPATGWATMYSPLQQLGLKIRVIDIHLDTLNIDVQRLERMVTPKTKLILAVNMLGNPAYLDFLKTYAKSNHLHFIENNCEGLGSEYKGKKTGTWGDCGTFSFYFTSQMSTMEGGMLVTDDKEIYHLTKCLRSHGLTSALPNESPLYQKKDDELEESCRFLLPGFNVRPLELVAAVGIEQLKKIDSMIEVRRQNACLFQESFSKDDRFLTQKEVGKSSWYSLSILLHPEWNFPRAKVLKALSDAGIQYRMIGCGNITRHDFIRYFQYEPMGDLRVANLVHDRGFYVGNYSQDLTRQLERLYKILSGLPGKISQRAA